MPQTRYALLPASAGEHDRVVEEIVGTASTYTHSPRTARGVTVPFNSRSFSSESAMLILFVVRQLFVCVQESSQETGFKRKRQVLVNVFFVRTAFSSKKLLQLSDWNKQDQLNDFAFQYISSPRVNTLTD